MTAKLAITVEGVLVGLIVPLKCHTHGQSCYSPPEFGFITVSISPLFADEVVDCMGEGRAPTVRELFRVAERIWSDGGADRSAFAWKSLSVVSVARCDAMRAAHLALCGQVAAAAEQSGKPQD